MRNLASISNTNPYAILENCPSQVVIVAVFGVDFDRIFFRLPNVIIALDYDSRDGSGTVFFFAWEMFRQGSKKKKKNTF